MSQPLKILLVEDQLWAESLAKWLEFQGGFKVFLAKRLISAFAIAAEHHPDLVLLDLTLDDSPEAEKTLPAAVGRFLEVPIVVLSGRTDAEEGEAQALAGGAVGYIDKRCFDRDREGAFARLRSWAQAERDRRARPALPPPIHREIEETLDRLEENASLMRDLARKPVQR